MIIEHTFITTGEPAWALESARRLLEGSGFIALGTGRAAEDGGTTRRSAFRRGKKRPGRARTLLELPQEVQIDYDRGRVALVASIQPWPTFLTMPYLGVALAKEGDHRQRRHKELLFALALAIEETIARREAGAAVQAWLDLEDRIGTEDRRANRRKWMIVGVVLALVLGLFAWAIRR